MTDNSLGKITSYQSTYNPDILYPISRHDSRKTLNLDFTTVYGIDRWNAYEVSWLNSQGKPEVGIFHIDVPSSSPFIVESKSLKLYLNGFNMEKIESKKTLIKCIKNDLDTLLQTTTSIHITPANTPYRSLNLEGALLDDLEIHCTTFHPDPSLLKTEKHIASETLKSHLFRSNCPVTNQPDWASIQITYKGLKLNPKSVLSYLVSYREHNGFHEACVEQIFNDIYKISRPESLRIIGLFTRRGGIDICPVRSTEPLTEDISYRHSRQ